MRDSGAELTVLRSTWFAQNFSEDFWREQVQAGELALPAGDKPEPFVDADDIADVVVAALTDDRHIGELYELTGPRLLTFAEAVRGISRAAGPMGAHGGQHGQPHHNPQTSERRSAGSTAPPGTTRRAPTATRASCLARP